MAIASTPSHLVRQLFDATDRRAVPAAAIGPVHALTAAARPAPVPLHVP